MFSTTWPWAGRIGTGSVPESVQTGGRKGPEPNKGIGDCGCCFSARAYAAGFHMRPCRWRKRSRRDHGMLTVRAF